MALFKILSNMANNTPPAPFSDEGLANVRTEALKLLPSTYNQGYCYFDITTGKFWIDTALNTANANNKLLGRIPINAYKADKSDIATASLGAVYATSATKDGRTDEIPIQQYYAHSLSIEDDNTICLRNAENEELGYVNESNNNRIPLGTHVTIYEWKSTS